MNETENDRQALNDPLAEYARIISGLVHDLRSPLTSIIGAASSLTAYADRFDAETRQRLLESIVEEADHLDRLLSNLSIVAKARSGALALDRREIGLEEVLLSTVSKAGQRAGAGTVSVRGDIPDLGFAADAGLIQVAILNLLEVGTRFAGGNGETAFTAKTSAAGLSLTWQTEVSPAMNERLANLLRAFEEEHRLEGVRASDLISLEAAREVVHSHGGRLTIDNSNVRSMRVVVDLPLTSSEDD